MATPAPRSRDHRSGLRLDAAAPAVLAHPLRARLLSRAAHRRPATATDLATRLSTNSGATSYHLRKLEAVGLVADTGEGEGKRRLWQAATDFHSCYAERLRRRRGLRDRAQLAGPRLRCGTSPQQFERWLDVRLLAAAWRDAAGMSDDFVVATAEQVERSRRDRRAARPVPPRRAGQPQGERWPSTPPSTRWTSTGSRPRGRTRT